MSPLNVPDVCEPCNMTSQGLSRLPGGQKSHGLLKERDRRGNPAMHVGVVGHMQTAVLAIFHLFLAYVHVASLPCFKILEASTSLF